MSKRYFHVSVNFSTIDRSEQLEPVFDHASDWLRYMPGCWIIHTAKSPRIWFERLRPILDDKDHCFIVAIDLEERAGWLPKSVWEWINSGRLVERAS